GRDTVEMCVPPPVDVALRGDQDVLAHRVQPPTADGARVRRRPEALGAAHRPPAGRVCLPAGHQASSSTPIASSAAFSRGYSRTRTTRPSRTVTTAEYRPTVK